MVFNPHQPPTEPISIETLILYRNFIDELHTHIQKLEKQVDEVVRSHPSTVVLLPKVAQASKLSKEEAREEMDKKLAQEDSYSNGTRKLNIELSKVRSAVTILKTTLIARSRKLSSTEIPLVAKAIAQLSPDNHTKALHVVNENSPNFQPSIETGSLDFQNDYILWRLHMFLKNSLEVLKGTSVSTRLNNIEVVDKKNNAKKRRVN